MNKDRSNKLAVVTGSNGFIGSHLVEKLFENGFSVRCLSHYNSRNDWGWLEDISCKDQVEVIVGDILDESICNRICEGADYIFHLAALIGIPYSYDAPNSYVNTNVIGTVNMCNASLRNGVKRFIQTSTSEVYGTAAYVPIDEKHPLQPQSPYSASKISSDSMAMSYYSSFDLPLTIARPFNTFGPRQSARAVIPTIITQLLSGTKKIKLGNTETTRDFNYVEDTCLGFLAIAESEDAIGQTINIGSNTEHSIKEVFDLACQLTSISDIELISDNQRIRPDKSEVYRLRCDNSKILKLTNYQSETDFESGLAMTIDWFKNSNNLLKYKTDIYNV